MCKNVLLSMLILLVTISAQAEQRTIQTGARVSVEVSNINPNAIRVSDDRIISLQATQGILTSKTPTPDGAIVFSTLADSPFTLFIQTASGFGFSLQATPARLPGLNLTIDNIDVRGTEQAQYFEQKQDSYSSLVSNLVSRFIHNRKPDGYVVTRSTQLPVSGAVEAAFTLRPVTAWQGDRIRIVRTEVTSRSTLPLRLSERYFWSPGVMAVSFHPQMDVISPGEQVAVITVFRTRGRGDEPQ
ncbi:TraK domain-containing protein [Pantoea sp. App145]|uniref:TraK domain-containing protein n=1 Tax=Pantoea sp. App145 TaxID=3071567 RepID=UPI003A7F977E